MRWEVETFPQLFDDPLWTKTQVEENSSNSSGEMVQHCKGALLQYCFDKTALDFKHILVREAIRAEQQLSCP